MTPRQKGFAEELTKFAVLGSLKSLGRFAWKHPILTTGAVAVPLATAGAARRGYEQGRSGGRGRYLKATSGRPSRAAHTNYHRLFHGRRGGKAQTRKTRHYREDAFER